MDGTHTTTGSLRLALCQIATEPGALDANLRRTLAALDRAHAAGAELAVTPECVLQGYPPQDTPGAHASLRGLAMTADSAPVLALRTQAARLRLPVLLGTAEQGLDGAVHNSAMWIDGSGQVRETYRTVHCRRFERVEGEGVFTPGDRFTTWAFRGRALTCRVGVLICFDREVPESVRTLRALGAELILCPLATDTWRLDAQHAEMDNETLTRCRAAENEVFIAVVNHAARFNGGSFVVGPAGNVLCQLGAAPEVRVVDIPVGDVGRRFHDNPHGWMGWEYRRPEAYGPLAFGRTP